MTEEAKHELVELLVRKAFDPVLAAKADTLSGPGQERPAHVQRATRAGFEDPAAAFGAR